MIPSQAEPLIHLCLLTCVPARATQGDVLSGCIAAYAAWAQRAAGASREELHDGGGGGGGPALPPLVLAAYAGCITTRWARGVGLPGGGCLGNGVLAWPAGAFCQAEACTSMHGCHMAASPALVGAGRVRTRAPAQALCGPLRRPPAAGARRGGRLCGSGAPWGPETCLWSWVLWWTRLQRRRRPRRHGCATASARAALRLQGAAHRLHAYCPLGRTLVSWLPCLTERLVSWSAS